MSVICPVCSKHRITQRTVRCVYIHIPVVSEEFLILIIVQSLEHSSTGHVVSIHDRIKIRKSSGICRVYEDCSIRAVLPICIMAQIIAVVTALQYRIIDICSRYVYPRTYILILFLKFIKVHLHMREYHIINSCILLGRGIALRSSICSIIHILPECPVCTVAPVMCKRISHDQADAHQQNHR